MADGGLSPSGATTPAPFTLRGALLGARDALPYAPSAFVIGIAFGLAARSAGLSLVEAVLMSGIVFAGSAQLLVLSIWSTPPAVLALVFATLAINSRFLLMGATLRPWFSRLPRRVAYPLLYFLVDAGWLLALRAREQGRDDAAQLLGSGLVFWVGWVVATAIGWSGGSALGDPRRLGLDFIMVAFFAAILGATWKGAQDLWSWGTAAAVSLLGAGLLPGAWYVLLGGLAGSLVGAWRHGR
ncbi:4-azaleucine resistance probable transporter AzlC [Tistlia consotensis]|uniref:4-azaleucine resistance probable transporter AzlC n=1 Tax=Tistlia consotensis USBA 355 TaxID=560819 RepID=A0A1Y6BLU0_9PROT|nr:AzlC family ABC transporter permease [Tistlia consotensis]SMF17770.1 4-azaleucine resistance probable transporter AzlC [Tistlia consotensis USBA 355]SNR40172.1 4-azaleucine resistance probable transporter AzlC [Tistlia consotensis]